MSTTAQDILDSTKGDFGLGTTETQHDAYLLNKLNRQILPLIRNEVLRSDEKYFNEIAYSDLVDGTDLYRPEKDRDKVAYVNSATPPVETPKNIRKLYALKCLKADSSRFYYPVFNAINERDETSQVSKLTSRNVWGYLFEGKEVRILDIPRADRTDGLQWDFAPEFVALAADETIPGLLDDFMYVLIDGLSMKLAQQLENTEQIKTYQTDFLIGRKDLIRHVGQRNTMNYKMGGGRGRGRR